MNTSIIKTALGRTIMVQWDETSPRPYSRLNLLQGTKGTLAGFPTRVALEGGVPGITKDHHSWAQGEDLEKLPLSEASVAQGGAPQPFPDFTRGKWEMTKPLSIVG